MNHVIGVAFVILAVVSSLPLAPSCRRASIRSAPSATMRVWVDGCLVIDRWTPHGSELAYAPIALGPHDIRVQYAQIGGWSELRVEVIRGRSRSTGSAGPH